MSLLMSIFFLANVYAEEVSYPKIQLIELFSSEGCSSCPPAEKMMYELVKSTQLWKEFVPINFHVDYWNRLGWVDRFSQKKFTERQQSYSTYWGKNRVYTPDFVADGVDQGVQLPKLTSQNKAAFKIDCEVSGDKLKVKTSGNFSSELKIYFALLANGLESKVLSGENSGKTLKHNFVVFDLQDSILKSQNEFVFKKPSIKYSSLAYAVWAENSKNGNIVQARGGVL